MKKRIKLVRLGRDVKHRIAMLRNLTLSLIYHERIRTTLPRAKALRSFVEKIVTKAKDGSLASRRKAGAHVKEKTAQIKLFTILGPRYKDRGGGYTRVLKLAKPREGDKADMAVIEFVDRDGELRPARPPTDSSSGFRRGAGEDLLRLQESFAASEQRRKNRVRGGASSRETEK